MGITIRISEYISTAIASENYRITGNKLQDAKREITNFSLCSDEEEVKMSFWVWWFHRVFPN